MAISPEPYYPSEERRVQLGLTLIEVLVALAILGIAMTAIIKATSQHIRATDHLQNKTMAMWVGQQVLNEVRVGLLSLPMEPAMLQQTTQLLGREWYWQVIQKKTPHPEIKKVIVRVFNQAQTGEAPTPWIQLESYLYHAA